MKVAQVSPKYDPSIGGVESHVKAISERLVEKGFEMDVLTTDPKGTLPREETIAGVHVRRFRSRAPSDAYYFSAELRAYLRDNSSRYSVVHAHSYHALPALYASQTKSGNKLVFTPHYHGTGHTLFRSLMHVPWKYYARQIFSSSDKVLSVSSFERDLLVRSFGLDPAQVSLVPDGLDLNEFSARRGARARSSADGSRILCVSRLEKYKGVQYILECLARLDGRFTLVVVGRGPYKGELEGQAERLGVSGRVRFLEGLSRQDLLATYQEASVFVLLSKYEAFGIVVAEALASGVPCVVSMTSALAEWVDDRTCFGVDYPIDVQKLADLVSRVASSPPVERRGILDWDQVSDMTAKVYDDLMGAGK